MIPPLKRHIHFHYTALLVLAVIVYYGLVVFWVAGFRGFVGGWPVVPPLLLLPTLVLHATPAMWRAVVRVARSNGHVLSIRP